MSTIIKPTIGRVVWFFNTPTFPEPRAAIICYVHSDSLVNLVTFDANGNPVPVTSVPLVQDMEPHPGEGCRCEWMPYQKAVASGQQAPVLHAVPLPEPQPYDSTIDHKLQIFYSILNARSATTPGAAADDAEAVYQKLCIPQAPSERLEA